MQGLQALIFLALLVFIIVIICVYLIGEKEKRPYVQTFYVVATLFCLIAMSTSIYNAMTPSEFMNWFMSKPREANDSQSGILDFIMLELETLNISLLAAFWVTIFFMMFHLNSTVALILVDSRQSIYELPNARRREKRMLIFCICIVIFVVLCGVACGIYYYLSSSSNNDSPLLQYLQHGCTIFLLCAMLLGYLITIRMLYKNIGKLEGMQEEKRETLKQAVIVLITSILKIALECYKLWNHAYCFQNEQICTQEFDRKVAFRLAWMHSIVSLIFRSVPLLYMLCLHLKTCKKDAELSKAVQEQDSNNLLTMSMDSRSDKAIIQTMRRGNHFSHKLDGLVVV